MRESGDRKEGRKEGRKGEMSLTVLGEIVSAFCVLWSNLDFVPWSVPIRETVKTVTRHKLFLLI